MRWLRRRYSLWYSLCIDQRRAWWDVLAGDSGQRQSRQGAHDRGIEEMSRGVVWSQRVVVHLLTREGEDALWQQVFMAQPARRREFEPSSKGRKRRPAPWPL